MNGEDNKHEDAAAHHEDAEATGQGAQGQARAFSARRAARGRTRSVARAAGSGRSPQRWSPTASEEARATAPRSFPKAETDRDQPKPAGPASKASAASARQRPCPYS